MESDFKRPVRRGGIITSTINSFKVNMIFECFIKEDKHRVNHSHGSYGTSLKLYNCVSSGFNVNVTDNVAKV